MRFHLNVCIVNHVRANKAAGIYIPGVRVKRSGKIWNFGMEILWFILCYCEFPILILNNI